MNLEKDPFYLIGMHEENGTDPLFDMNLEKKIDLMTITNDIVFSDDVSWPTCFYR